MKNSPKSYFLTTSAVSSPESRLINPRVTSTPELGEFSLHGSFECSEKTTSHIELLFCTKLPSNLGRIGFKISNMELFISFVSIMAHLERWMSCQIVA